MLLPIKILTSDTSFLILKITIPLWLKFKLGFNPTHVKKDEMITFMCGEEVSCLHVYVLSFRWRIRSNLSMEKLEHNGKRNILSFSKGWSQLFDSAII